ncbi:acetate--CoA ligase family protein, partial [Kibdelosporangium lantanae]
DGDTSQRWLTDQQAFDFLSCYGIQIAPFRIAHSADEAAQVAEELGFPVAAKAANSLLRHRFDLVGVRLDISGPDAMRAAYGDIRAVSGVDEVYVQRMVDKGTSCAIGLQDDPSFGTLVSFGLSGVVNDLLGDRAYRAIPMTMSAAPKLVMTRSLGDGSAGCQRAVRTVHLAFKLAVSRFATCIVRRCGRLHARTYRR